MKYRLFLTVFIFILCSVVYLPAAFSWPSDTQEEATIYFENFLKTWLIEQDVDKAVSFIDQNKDYADCVKAAWGVPPKENFDVDLWLRKTLTMWLFKDHGEANSLGHGDPRKPGYDRLPAKPSDIPNRIRPKSLGEAAQYQIFNEPNPDSLVAVVRLRNAPLDSVIFRIEQTGNGWKITFYFWMVAP